MKKAEPKGCLKNIFFRKVLLLSDKPCNNCRDVVYIYVGWRDQIVCSTCGMVMQFPYKKK